MASTSLILQNVKRTESYYFACGGFADLFKGQWTRQSGEVLLVVIKQVRRCTWNDKAAAERARKRFLREAELWAKLHHPYIVPFYGIIFEREFPGLVMPYYKNGDLTEFLRKYPQTDILDLITQVAAGLEYLHTMRPNPVVHGDIKASNIMVTDDRHARLADFGVAKMLYVSGYTTTSIGGSCRWMSPEILEGSDPSATVASDIWAFAMTILQLYTGKVPFGNLKNDATVIISLTRGYLPQQPPEIEDSLWALLKRCWVTEAFKRPAAPILSIVLHVMTTQKLTPQEINDLVDHLQAEGHDLKDDEALHLLSPASTSDTLVHDSVEKQGKSAFAGSLRKLSLLPRDTLPFGTLMRRGSDGKRPEPPRSLTVLQDSLTFGCYWPECGVHLNDLESWKAHQVPHLLSWKANKNNDAVVTPRISHDT
ncbi:Protein sevenless [Leucoagaricus sp. SymC.cos]|nr:Protein sevenless [Leucoagaricus sp. SymC.cos]